MNGNVGIQCPKICTEVLNKEQHFIWFCFQKLNKWRKWVWRISVSIFFFLCDKEFDVKEKSLSYTNGFPPCNVHLLCHPLYIHNRFPLIALSFKGLKPKSSGWMASFSTTHPCGSQKLNTVNSQYFLSMFSTVTHTYTCTYKQRNRSTKDMYK